MEKYGTVPPKFTKAWWSYFWEYYKIHTISIAVAAVAVGTSLYQCATKTEYDLTLSYVGNQSIGEESQQIISQNLSSSLDEITGNDQIDILYMNYTIDPGDDVVGADAEYNYAMQVKFTAELQIGVSDVYIMSAENAKKDSVYSDCFIDVSELSDKHYSEDEVLKDENGKIYAVSLKNSRILNDSGVDTSELYLVVRDLYEKNEKKEEYILNHENSLKAAALLLEE